MLLLRGDTLTARKSGERFPFGRMQVYSLVVC
jgi:hypothetical protein